MNAWRACSKLMVAKLSHILPSMLLDLQRYLFLLPVIRVIRVIRVIVMALGNGPYDPLKGLIRALRPL